DKLIEISTAEVRKRQRERLSNEESKTLANVRAKAKSEATQDISADIALQFALEHVFERVSVARDYEILAHALRFRPGQIAHPELKNALAAAQSSGAVLRHGNEIATISTLQREREMVQTINRGIGACEPLAGAANFISADRLRPEQQRVIQFVLR